MIVKTIVIIFFQFLHALSELLLPSAKISVRKAELARPVSGNSEGEHRIWKNKTENEFQT